MQYLITSKDHKPFITKWFEVENHFTIGMVVYDLINHCYTTDGIVWLKIESDHL